MAYNHSIKVVIRYFNVDILAKLIRRYLNQSKITFFIYAIIKVTIYDINYSKTLFILDDLC